MNVLYRNISKYSRNKLLLTWDLKQIKHFGYSLNMNHVFRANRSSVIWAHRSFYVSERAIRLGIKRWKICAKKLSKTNEQNFCLTNRSLFLSDSLESRANYWRCSFLKKLRAIRARSLLCKERQERKGERANSQPWSLSLRLVGFSTLLSNFFDKFWKHATLLIILWFRSNFRTEFVRCPSFLREKQN